MEVIDASTDYMVSNERSLVMKERSSPGFSNDEGEKGVVIIRYLYKDSVERGAIFGCLSNGRQSAMPIY